MTLPLWGTLEKSLDDSETIEEAIDRIVAEHNADSEAHLGSGESLQQHRSDEILDALAGSVVRDKIAFDRFIIDTYFESLDGWTKSGAVTLYGISNVALEIGSSPHTSRMYTDNNDALENIGGLANNPRFAALCAFRDVHANVTFYVGQMTDAPAGYYFKIVGTTLYAGFFDGGGSENNVSVGTIVAGTLYRLELETDETGVSRWIVDGSVLRTSTVDQVPEGGKPGWFEVTNGVNNDTGSLWVVGFHYDEDLP